jgi:hypothetical protein
MDVKMNAVSLSRLRVIIPFRPLSARYTLPYGEQKLICVPSLFLVMWFQKNQSNTLDFGGYNSSS